MAQLSLREQRRLAVLGQLLAGGLSTAEAARKMRLSVRQAQRLASTLLSEGAGGLAHGNRGRRSTRRLPDELRERVATLATTTYAGLNIEQLFHQIVDREGLAVSRSTIRRVLLERGARQVRSPRPRRLPVGFMPIAFDLNNRLVELLDLRGADFRDSFFHQTVERWRREQPLALRLQLSLPAFTAVARLDPPAAPAGFIFQTGRGGSKLLSDTLAAAPQSLVIRESSAINTLVARWLSASQRGDTIRRAELETLLALTISFMSRGPRQIIIKLSSWNAGFAQTLLALFPTPAVFLYEQAVPSVVSMLARPPGWRSLVGPSRAAQARFFPSLAAAPAELSLVELYAHVWRSLVESMLAVPAERVMALDAADLNDRIEQTLSHLLEHFQITLSPAQRSVMAAVGRSHAREEVRADSLDPGQSAAVAAIVGSLQGKLERHRIAAFERFGVDLEARRTPAAEVR